MKVIKWIVIVLLLILVIGGIALYMNLNRIIRSTVETQATQSMNLQTTLAGANFRPVAGRLQLNDLRIASPKGYQSLTMFDLNQAVIDVSYGQLRSEPIHIAGITLNNPQLVVEQAGGKFNVKAAMDQMPPSPENPMQLVIDKLLVNDAVVIVKPNVPGLKEQLTIKLPPIEMANVGSGEGAQNGAALREVLMKVMNEMAAKAADSDQIPPELKTFLTLNTDELKNRIGQELNKQVQTAIENLGKDVSPQLKEQAGKVLEQGLGDLLKQPAKKEPAK